MQITIRKFEKKDISNKVRWINDPQNHAYLHYDLPLEEDKTEAWFEKNHGRQDRYDAVILVDNIPVGLIGLLSIDFKNSKAEYYVLLGERTYLGKGIAAGATLQLLYYAYEQLGLNRVYLYTEVDNTAAIRLYERIGFKREGLLKDDLFFKGHYVDRYLYGLNRKDFNGYSPTPLQYLATVEENRVYAKREDLLPFSFGGNKARKAQLFFDEIDRGQYDCVVTYGSSSSNHCRVVSNMAASRGMECHIISPEEASEETENSRLMQILGAQVTVCPVNAVHTTIEATLERLKALGKQPYFIAGGGHGNIGTQAYVECYEEIRQYEKENRVHFDYIFHATGTGTTQAGLICGQLVNRDQRKIVGVSIARKNPRGRDVVIESVRAYLKANKVWISESLIESATIFDDAYVGDGYGKSTASIRKTIQNNIVQFGIPLDETYTGKAFDGMLDYLKKNKIKQKNVLFIHTGGTPLFFDLLDKI